jgi:hypothetical protein
MGLLMLVPTSLPAVHAPPQQHYPPSVQDMLEDSRFPNVVRHLRDADPVSGQPFELLRDPLDHGIEGVVSPARGEPLKIAHFPEADRAFTGAQHYSGWRFEFAPPAPPGRRAAGQTAR